MINGLVNKYKLSKVKIWSRIFIEMKKMSDDLQAQIKPFPSSLAWEKWLSKKHSLKQGLWLQIAKKDSGIPSVTYEQALDAALCYGWIDGQKKTYDKNYFLQKFTPRRPKSLWSKRNVAKALELIASAKMKAPGLAEIKSAQADGRWEAAYDSPKDMKIPADFIGAVNKNKKAKAYFTTLKKTSLYSLPFGI